MTTPRCPICGEYLFLKSDVQRHRCKPAWFVRRGEADFSSWEWQRIFAGDVEEAVQKFAAHFDAELCEVTSEMIVVVEDEAREHAWTMQVSGELQPHYYVMSDIEEVEPTEALEMMS